LTNSCAYDIDLSEPERVLLQGALKDTDRYVRERARIVLLVADDKLTVHKAAEEVGVSRASASATMKRWLRYRSRAALVQHWRLEDADISEWSDTTTALAMMDPAAATPRDILRLQMTLLAQAQTEIDNPKQRIAMGLDITKAMTQVLKSEGDQLSKRDIDAVLEKTGGQGKGRDWRPRDPGPRTLPDLGKGDVIDTQVSAREPQVARDTGLPIISAGSQSSFGE